MLFSIFLMLSIILWALIVLRATNAVHGVLALVVVFALTALLFLLLGAEFFALLIFTVYIGAIAILFLFVIMMLDLRLAELHGSLYYHVPLGASVGFVFLGILYSLLAPDIFTVAWSSLTPDLWLVAPQSNLKVLGQALYNYYVLYVVLVTLLLLLAMVGAIALTLDDSRARRPEASPEMPRSDWNYYWTNYHSCSKGLEKSPWWAPLDPALAHRRVLAADHWRKWPAYPIRSATDCAEEEE